MGITAKALKDDSSRIQVCFRNHCFLAEVALTEKERLTGLMFRKKLTSKKAMLFIFPDNNYHSFWMKNVLIPLDIIWLDQNRKIVYLAENCQPCSELPCQSIKPDSPARYVLEIKGGRSQQIGLAKGDILEFKGIE